MITGTSHFVSFEKAVSYYKDYDFDAADVRRKVDEGEIHIGKPTINPHRKLKVNSEGRYVIEDRQITIGGVTFGKLTGENWPDGNPKWQHTSIMGQERVKLLMDVRRGNALPEGLILIGQIPGGYTPITKDNVAWETSGLPES